MKTFLKTYWKTLAFFAVMSLFGGFFTGIYLLDSYPADIQQQILAQGIDAAMLGLIMAVQAMGYGIVLGAVGILLGKKTGLWKDETVIEKKPLMATLAVALTGGLVMILSDILFFGHYSEAIMSSYAVKPAIPYLIGTVTYGAVTEEIMLRLFWMSLLAFLLHRLFGKKTEFPSAAIVVTANVIAALLFAAGHLPTTFQLLGNSPMIIARCFLLNGGIGLLFGELYRKYGLRYAMIAHGGCHVISKLIWILFL